MSQAAHSLSDSSPSLSDAIKQVSAAESEDLHVSCLNRLTLAFDDYRWIQDSGLGLLANSRNTLITGGIFVVSFFFCELYKQINNCTNFICQNIIPSNTKEKYTKIPIPQKPNSSPLFVGRKDILDKLWKFFFCCDGSQSKLRCSCLLWGTGGIGKTQICLRFVEEMSGRFSYVFWVDASSVERIIMSLRGMFSFPAAQASCVDDSVESILQWMSGIQEEWLIVFDNAEPPVHVDRFIPPGNRGNILITSRNRSMGRVVSFENKIEINEMEEADAITLLLKASSLDASAEHIEVARNIVTELGCMPLAVDQAGAYIEAGRCSIDKYLQQFSLRRQTLMSDATFRGASNYDRTVYGTWDLSFNEIKKRAGGQSSAGDAQAAHAAILILQICAFYHHSNISKDIFRSAAEESREHVVDSELVGKLPLAISSLDCTLLALDNNGHWDEFIFGQGIAVLLSFSLMKIDKSSKMLSIHPLVHCWSREQMSKSDQQSMYEMGGIILCCAISQRLSSYDYGLRRLIFPHIKANELHGSQMGLTNKYYDDKWTNFLFVIREIGDWKHAEQLLLQALEKRKNALGKEHRHTLLTMSTIARIYANQGRWNEAEQLDVQVLDIKQKLFGVEHPDTVKGMASLARTYADKGNLKEAEQLRLQVLEMRKKLFGTEHPDTLRSMANLARTYADKGNLKEAEKLEIQVLDSRKEVLGAEHPCTLLSMGNLAGTYSSQGKLKEAEKLEVQVLDMRKKLLGAEHPDTLKSMTNLACTYSRQGKWNEAERIETQVLVMRKKLLGAEHPDTLLSMGNLAGTFLSWGNLKEAEKLEIQVLEMRKKLLGAEHPDTLISMANLANTYSSRGKLIEAEQLEVQVLDMSMKQFGAEHPDTLRIMANLAGIYADKGKLKEAEQLEVEVLTIRKKLLGAEHPDTLISMVNLASTYSSQGRWNEAEQLEVQVLDMSKKHLGEEHPDTLRSMANLATTYAYKGICDESEQLEVQVLDMRKKLLGVEHPDTLLSMGNLARTYADKRNFDEAEQLEVQVLDMRKKLLGAEHPDTLISMANLARTYADQGNFKKAEQLEGQVLDKRNKVLGVEHPCTILSMGNLAGTYKSQGKLREAEQLEVQVLEMRKKLFGAQHPDTLLSMGNLARTYSRQGKKNKAKRLDAQVLDMKKKLYCSN